MNVNASKRGCLDCVKAKFDGEAEIDKAEGSSA